MYRSVDGGLSWIRQDVSALGPYSLVNTRYADPGAVYVPRVRLAVAPSNPDAVVMASAASRGDRVLTSDFDDLERLRSYFPGVRLLQT